VSQSTTDTQQVAPPPAGAIINFAQLVAAVESGELNADATREMQRLVAQLNDELLIGRKTSASISVRITLTADRGVIDTIGDLAVKEVKKPRSRSILYIRQGVLTPRDERQADLPFRTVDAPPTAFRTV
jgi:hypothetical protein